MGYFFKSHRIETFCAFCRSPRRHYRQRNLGPFHLVLCLFTSLLASSIIFQELDPRLILFFVICVVVSEIFIHFRWRMGLVCKHCGFDPLVYTRDQAAAAILVKQHLTRRKKSAEALLARPLRLPHLTSKRAMDLEIEENRPRLSKQFLS